MLNINDFDTITKSPKPTQIWPKSYLRILYRFFYLRKLKTKALKDLQSKRIPHCWQLHPYGHLDQWLASFNIISMQCKEKFSYNHLFFSIRNKNLPFFLLNNHLFNPTLTHNPRSLLNRLLWNLTCFYYRKKDLSYFWPISDKLRASIEIKFTQY